MQIEKNLTFQTARSLKRTYSGSLLCRSDLLCRAREKEMYAYKGNCGIMKRTESSSKLALYSYWNTNQHLIWGSFFITSVSVYPELLYCHWLVCLRVVQDGWGGQCEGLRWLGLTWAWIKLFRISKSAKAGVGRRKEKCICALYTARGGGGSSSILSIQLWREDWVWLHIQQRCCPFSAPLCQHRIESTAGAEVVCLPEPRDTPWGSCWIR